MRKTGLPFVLFLTGCATLTPVLDRKVDVLVYPRFAEKTQAVVEPYSLSSIATLDILPYVEVTPGSYSPISSITGNATTPGASDMLKLTQLSPVDPSRPFVLRGLRPNTNYRVYGRAYNAVNAQISLDSTSFTSVLVGNDDRPAIAQLPIHLVPVPFAATTSVTVNPEGRFDFLRGTLYLLSGNTQVAVSQTTRANPDFTFGNLQGNTSYRLVVDAYKLGASVASSSVDLSITNETAPATASLALSVPYVVTTLAGNGVAGYLDDTALAAKFNFPCRVGVDPMGNVYVADRNNHRIRKVSSSGQVTTLAGSGNAAFADGTGTAASFSSPEGLAVDTQGNVYVADFNNHRIRKIDPNGVTTTLAGNGSGSYLDGTSTAAVFNCPSDIAVGSNGLLYIADRGNNRIRKMTSDGVVTTVAGNGGTGLVNGSGTSAQLWLPWGIDIDNQGNLFVADYGNTCVRKITSAGDVSTYAGDGIYGFNDGPASTAEFRKPVDVAVDTQGNVFVADFHNYGIRRISPSGQVTRIVGYGTTGGFADGTATASRFAGPHGVVVDAMGNLYVADREGQRIRKIQ